VLITRGTILNTRPHHTELKANKLLDVIEMIGFKSGYSKSSETYLETHEKSEIYLSMNRVG
jgi:hypothetical protein